MKNYLIIGASSGIGKKLADMLANSGNKVYGTFCTKPIQNNTSRQSIIAAMYWKRP
jgi:NAD(P)-dependent dehydrogenase (short-subunit alcohol dehydrogenase family)